MNDQLKQWQDETMPADEFWRDIVTHGANSGGAISDETFADGMAAIAGITQQMNVEPKDKKASAKGKANQKAGVTSEKYVKRAFEAIGFFGVHKLETKYNPFRKTSSETVADFMAVQKGTGKSALIEAKNITKDRLPHSRLKHHQLANLTLWRENNALAYIAITKKVRGRWKTAVLVHPVTGVVNGKDWEFKKGTSILWDWAWENRVNK